MGEPAPGQSYVRNVTIVLDTAFRDKQGAKTFRKVTERAQVQAQFMGEDVAGFGVLYEQKIYRHTAAHTA